MQVESVEDLSCEPGRAQSTYENLHGLGAGAGQRRPVDSLSRGEPVPRAPSLTPIPLEAGW